MLQINELTYRIAGRVLFNQATVAVAKGRRAGLVGPNGSGKTTLLRLIAGALHADGGSVSVPPRWHIGIVAQEAPDGPESLLDTVLAADAERTALLDEAETTTDPHRIGEVHTRLADIQAHAAPARAAAILAGLGFDEAAQARPCAELSGGMRMRVALAATLFTEPDLLLLDEPTNHLDLPTIEWLEAELAGRRAALLLVSHDRAFLTALSRRMLWLDRGSLRTLDQGFEAFEGWAEAVYAAEEREQVRLDKRIATETQWLREGLTARRRRNQGRVRALQQMRADRRERLTRSGLAKLDPAEARRSGRLVIEAERITKQFAGSEGEQTVVRDFSTRILRGDRVGIIGPNGAGKTTLVRMLTGQMPPDEGTLRFGTGIELAYFDQRRESLDLEAPVREILAPGGGDQVMVGGRPRHVAGYLKDFLFDPSRLDSPVRSLSGGERNRLLLARLFARPSNLLVLDEPTNDLDIETLDLLEDVLGDYSGTLLLVSHDRDFLDRLVASIIAVEGGGVVDEYVGGYSDYVRQRRAQVAPPSGRPRAKAAPPRDRAQKEQRKLSYRQQRELDMLPGEIDRMTAEIEALARTLSDPELYARDPETYATKTERLAATQEALAQAEERWLELAELAEQLTG